MKRIVIIAGESSGDLHGSSLIENMKKLRADLAFKGIGGPLMIKQGLDPLRRVNEMNFMGFVEVIRHLPFLRSVMNELESLLDSWSPDLVVLIDYPGFNLRFAPRVKKRGIPLMYYISPQLWAWHKSRVSLVRDYVDRMVVLFDFERTFYRNYGIEADFVGHPLLDVARPSMTRDNFRKELGLGDETPLIGLLPGSRPQEIDRILPAMTGSLPLLQEKLGSLKVILGCAPEIDDTVYYKYLSNFHVTLMRNRTYDIMAHADAVVVTSGTATLETGILGTPMLIVYRTSLLTYITGKFLVNIPNIGLINIVAGGRIVPELWQNQVRPDTIADIIEKLIIDKKLRHSIQSGLDAAKSRLGSPGASDRASSIALEMMRN